MLQDCLVYSNAELVYKELQEVLWITMMTLNHYTM